MIKRINIGKFGQFENYRWRESISGNLEFKSFNIIYGRNYSGKTTLSRIFRCLEERTIHNDYQQSEFQFECEGGVVDQIGIATQTDFSVRVYNVDFVKKNLGWLHNAEGTIEPFTILGSVNVEIESRIRSIDNELGDVQGNGLRSLYATIHLKCEDVRKQLSVKKDSLTSRLQDKARSIKLATKLYNSPIYSISNLKNDLQSVGSTNVLSFEEKEALIGTLNEVTKPSILEVVASVPNFKSYWNEVSALVSKKIPQSQPLDYLSTNPQLQEWVRSGIELHHGVLNSCGFCGSELPDDIWERLGAHFVKEADDFRSLLVSLKVRLEKVIDSLKSLIKLDFADFYSGLHATLNGVLNEWRSAVEIYEESINKLTAALERRILDVFKPFEIEYFEANTDQISSILGKVNGVIIQNNELTKSLAETQARARLRLRLSEVAEYKSLIRYDHELLDINAFESDVAQRENELMLLKEKILSLEKQKSELVNQMKDESRGAELVNQYLEHFFGHEELKLAPYEIGAQTKFRIMRGPSPAKNLSEGECSLISFCYFIAMMQDELMLNDRRLIIYIDDPISSLDSNHTYFIFSLIESVITRPKRYHQLFISTHSLEFLKYVKRLTRPGREEKFVAYFLQKKISAGSVKLLNAPDYLKKYITEFNFLFSEIFACAGESDTQAAEYHQYGFGNNLRKFLESYLFFKYPNQALGLSDRLGMFFGEDLIAYNLVNRIINELSHLEEQFDRSVIPIDSEEIRKVALIVIRKLIVADPAQYNALCESVEVDGAKFIEFGMLGNNEEVREDLTFSDEDPY